MKRYWIGALLTAGLVCSLALARPGVVRTRDGRAFEGDVTEKEETVVINIRGVETTLNREDVLAVEYPANLDEVFHDRLAKLDAKDVAGRLALARWAFDNRRYTQARDVLEEALTIDPNSRDATDLLETVRRQMRLEAAKAAAPPAATVPSRREQQPPGAGGADRRLLSAEDINVIRQVELKRGENVPVRFDNDVRRRYALAHNVNINDFNALTPVQQAEEILRSPDPRLRADVKIMRDPAAIAEFKRVIQPRVLTGCAATHCHGGQGAGGLTLIIPADTDAATYTNFYLLQQYRKDVPSSGPKGVFGGGKTQRLMIDRANPEQSLLVQFALPPQVAEFDHPEERSYRPMFPRGKADPQYQQFVQWIGQTLAAVDPVYGINPPPALSTTRPATEPTTAPH